VVGRFYINGFLQADLGPCDGASHRWTGTVTGATGQFGKGSATLLSGDAQACNDFECADAPIPATPLQLRITHGTNPTPTPPPGDLKFTIDPTGTLDRATNTATISGTFTCSGGGVAVASGVLRQIVGRMFVQGFSGGPLGECDGTTQPWTAQIIANTGLFVAGDAIVADAIAGICDQDLNNCTEAPITGHVHLNAVGKSPPFGVPPAGPGSPSLVVNISRWASLDRGTNTATIRGSITCTESNAVPEAFLTVRQVLSRIFIEGYGGPDAGVCDGLPHRWSAQVIGQTGKFAYGPAAVFGDAFACNDVECVDTPFNVTAFLRPSFSSLGGHGWHS
jgi:hypothetical protein